MDEKKHRITYWLRDEEEATKGELTRITLAQLEEHRFGDSPYRRHIRDLEDVRGLDLPRTIGELDYTLMYKENGELKEV
jgi:hypothetical protein